MTILELIEELKQANPDSDIEIVEGANTGVYGLKSRDTDGSARFITVVNPDIKTDDSMFPCSECGHPGEAGHYGLCSRFKD